MTNIAAISRDSNTITVANFYENFRRHKYNLSPDYQRLSVWSEEKQSFFIDSILKNFPIPPIFLHQHIDDMTGETLYDVVDGKQRLLSIVAFIENEIPASNEFQLDEFDDPRVAGVYFRDLDQPDLAEYKRRFWRYVMPIEYIDTRSKKVVDNIFDRLNRNGEPLTGQELRNAKYHGSDLLNLVEDLADTPYWKERLAHVDLTRMENYEFVSELLFVILEKGPLEALPRIIDTLYERYAKASIDWLAVRTSFDETTGFLEDLDLDYDLYKIKGVSHLYGLWCLAWRCLGKKVLPSSVVDPLNGLFAALRSDSISDERVQEYKRTMSSSTKSKLMRDRRLHALTVYCGV